MSIFFGVRSTKVGTWKTPAEYGGENSASARIFGARSTSQNGAERRGVHFRTPYSENLLRVHPYVVQRGLALDQADVLGQDQAARKVSSDGAR